jgi:ribosomal-protein-alanine N-acetyltransferase
VKLPFFSAPADFAIEALTEDDARLLPVVHREDFSRPWSGGEFETLLGQDGVFGFAAWRVGNRKAGPVGFVLARHAAGEAEILTVAVLRACRGLGVGRDLMEAVLRDLHAARAETLFLEVDETNAPAIALYRRLGFREVARRPGYYDWPGGRKSDALVMRRDLR